MSIRGKLLGIAVKVGGTPKKIRCQTDGNLTIAQDTESGEPCKDDSLWQENFVTGKNFSLSVTAKAFLDSVELNQSDIIELLLSNGEEPVEVEFLSDATPGAHGYPENIVFSGNAIIQNFDWAAPVGESTYTIDFLGTGMPTYDRIPVVS